MLCPELGEVRTYQVRFGGGVGLTLSDGTLEEGENVV